MKRVRFGFSLEWVEILLPIQVISPFFTFEQNGSCAWSILNDSDSIAILTLGIKQKRKGLLFLNCALIKSYSRDRLNMLFSLCFVTCSYNYGCNLWNGCLLTCFLEYRITVESCSHSGAVCSRFVHVVEKSNASGLFFIRIRRGSRYSYLYYLWSPFWNNKRVNKNV